MSAPQSNSPSRDQPSGHIPSVISVPTTRVGAMQTMLNMDSSHQAGSQGAPAATRDIYIPTSAQEFANMAEALVHASPTAAPASPHAHAPPPGSPPPPAPAPATQFISDITVPPVAPSTSSHGGRPHSSPQGTARVTRSSYALPELGYIQPQPMLAPGDEAYRRSTTHHGPKCFAFRINTRDSDDQEKRKVRVYSLIAISVFADRPVVVSLFPTSSSKVLWVSDWNRRSMKPG